MYIPAAAAYIAMPNEQRDPGDGNRDPDDVGVLDDAHDTHHQYRHGAQRQTPGRAPRNAGHPGDRAEAIFQD